MIVEPRPTYFQEAIFSKQTAGTFQEVPSERGNHLKGRKFVSKICRVKISLDFFVSFCVKTKRKEDHLGFKDNMLVIIYSSHEILEYS
jgi:hypothetical protein